MSSNARDWQSANKRVFGVRLCVAARRSDPRNALVPSPISFGIRWLAAHNGDAADWLAARDNDQEHTISELKAQMDQGLRVLLDDAERPGTVAGMMMRYLEAVPEGAIPMVPLSCPYCRNT